MPEVEVEVLALASEVEAPVLVVVAEELRPPVGQVQQPQLEW